MREARTTDTSVLKWESGRKRASFLIVSAPRGVETVVTGPTPPSDKEFEKLLSKTRDISLRSGVGELGIGTSIDGAQRPPILIARYVDGEMVSFFRPPWRKGARGDF